MAAADVQAFGQSGVAVCPSTRAKVDTVLSTSGRFEMHCCAIVSSSRKLAQDKTARALPCCCRARGRFSGQANDGPSAVGASRHAATRGLVLRRRGLGHASSGSTLDSSDAKRGPSFPSSPFQFWTELDVHLFTAGHASMYRRKPSRSLCRQSQIRETQLGSATENSISRCSPIARWTRSALLTIRTTHIT